MLALDRPLLVSVLRSDLRNDSALFLYSSAPLSLGCFSLHVLNLPPCHEPAWTVLSFFRCSWLVVGSRSLSLGHRTEALSKHWPVELVPLSHCRPQLTVWSWQGICSWCQFAHFWMMRIVFKKKKKYVFCGGQRTTFRSRHFSSLWVLRIELWSSALCSKSVDLLKDLTSPKLKSLSSLTLWNQLESMPLVEHDILGV